MDLFKKYKIVRSADVSFGGGKPCHGYYVYRRIIPLLPFWVEVKPVRQPYLWYLDIREAKERIADLHTARRIRNINEIKSLNYIGRTEYEETLP